jgi:hypothetical protein
MKVIMVVVAGRPLGAGGPLLLLDYADVLSKSG